MGFWRCGIFYGCRMDADRLSRQVILAQYLAVRQHDGENASRGLSVLDRFDRHSNLIARLEDLLAPASLDHIRCVTGLRYPVHGLAGFILHIEFQPAMWIGPHPFS